MNVIGNVATILRKQDKILLQQQQQYNEYDGIINFYDSIPNYELTLDEFELYALKRLRVLRKIEQLQMMRQRYKPDEIRKVIDDVIKKEGLHTTSNNSNNINIDEASHYILRISYCQTEELRKWFLTMECELLRHRLYTYSSNSNNSSSNTNTSNSNSNNSKGNGNNNTAVSFHKTMKSALQLRSISNERKMELQEPLEQLLLQHIVTLSPLQQQQQASTMMSSWYQNTQFYSVPFYDAFDLIQKRECYLYQGYAYITQYKLISIVLQKFRITLSQTLYQMCQQQHITLNNTNTNNSTSKSSSSSNSNTVAESQRLEPFLKNIHRCLTNPTSDDTDMMLGGTDGNGTHLTASTILQYHNNMPLCMRQLQIGLQLDHKLKHWGRLQYGLFLKGAGLSMDDAILFFQRHFTAVTNEQFHKEYSYGIRHMYGKEGKRASYTPYNCTKIILGNAPTSGTEHHGCPYKHYDVDHLDTVLREIHITNPIDRNAIIKLKQSHQYQLACVKQFEIQHSKYYKNNNNTNNMDTSILDNVGNHPNAWFKASVYYQHQLSNNNNNNINNSNNNATTTTTTTINNNNNNNNATTTTTISP